MRSLSFGLLLLATAATAQTGTLDLTFGTNGVQIDSFSTQLAAWGVAALPDGRILLAGSSREGASTPQHGLLAWYSADGTREQIAGFTSPAPGCFDVNLSLYELALGPDGDIYAGGYVQADCAGTETDMYIRRMDPSGAVTQAYDSPVYSGALEYAYAFSLQPDGALIAVGQASASDERSSFDVAVARYTPDGTLDAAFGTNGEVLLDVAGDYDFAYDVALQPDGKLILTGASTIGGQSDLLLARLNADGTPDAAFGTNGLVTIDYEGGDDVGLKAAIQSDGKILVGGRQGGSAGAGRFLAARFLPDGAPDPSFGTAGAAIVDFTGQSASLTGFMLQSDGKIVASGITESGAGGLETRDVAIARLLPNGALDPSFSADGKERVAVTAGQDTARDLVIMPDGDIVVVGYSEETVGGQLGQDIFLVRIVGDTAPVANAPTVETALALAPPRPNPAHGDIALAFELAETGPVRLSVHDALGREVAVPVEGLRQAGAHEARLDASALAPGVYVARLGAGAEAVTRTLTVIR